MSTKKLDRGELEDDDETAFCEHLSEDLAIDVEDGYLTEEQSRSAFYGRLREYRARRRVLER